MTQAGSALWAKHGLRRHADRPHLGPPPGTPFLERRAPQHLSCPAVNHPSNYVALNTCKYCTVATVWYGTVHTGSYGTYLGTGTVRRAAKPQGTPQRDPKQLGIIPSKRPYSIIPYYLGSYSKQHRLLLGASAVTPPAGRLQHYMGLLSLYINNKAGGLIYHKVRKHLIEQRPTKIILTVGVHGRTLLHTALSSMSTITYGLHRHSVV